MKITVATVAYNSAATISRTIESFIAQNYKNKEMLIIDGASTDSTMEIVSAYRRHDIKFISEPDDGLYDAMNKAFNLFDGDAIGFLNSDDTFSNSNSLSAIAQTLARSDIATGHVRFVRSHETKSSMRTWRATAHARNAFRTGWATPHPGVYCRRRVVETVGNFDVQYKIGADYDWLLRAFEIHGFSNEVIDQIVVDMLVGGASTSGLRALITNVLEPLRARRKWLGAGIIDYAALARLARRLNQVGSFRN